MCDADMLKEKTGTIEDEEFDGDTMERMVDFAYKGDYKATRPPRYLPAEETEHTTAGISSLEIEDAQRAGGVALPQDDISTMTLDEEPAKLSPTDQWIIHARVYTLAEYYKVSGLRDYAYNCSRRVAGDDIELKGIIKVARAVFRQIIRDDGSLCTSYDSPLRTAFLSTVALYAPRLAMDSDFAVALYEPNLQDVSADNEALQRSETSIEENADQQVSAAQHRQRVAEERLQHHEGVTQRLMRSLRNLPASCGNQNCGNEFGSLKFERNGNGDWQVRCGARKCRCKLS